MTEAAIPTKDATRKALEKTLKYQQARLDFEDAGFIITIVPAIPLLNPAYARTLALKMDPHQLSFVAKAMTGETAARVLAETYVETVIVNWEGDVPEDRVQYLVDEDDVLQEVVKRAQNLATFMGEEVED
jgi:hypothetical protein